MIAWSEKMEILSSKIGGDQSHYINIEVEQGTIFLEQNMRIGQLAILKKSFGPIMSNFWEHFFHVLRGKNFRFNFF